METISYYFYYLDAHFYGFPPIVRMTVLLIMLLGSLYLISFSRILVNAYRLRKAKIRRNKTKGKYESHLQNIIFSQQDLSAYEIEDQLNMGTQKLKAWEKVYITELLVTMVNEK